MITAKVTTRFYPSLASSLSQQVVGQVIQLNYFTELIQALNTLSIRSESCSGDCK